MLNSDTFWMLLTAEDFQDCMIIDLFCSCQYYVLMCPYATTDQGIIYKY